MTLLNFGSAPKISGYVYFGKGTLYKCMCTLCLMICKSTDQKYETNVTVIKSYETNIFFQLQLRAVKQMVVTYFHLSDREMKVFYSCWETIFINHIVKYEQSVFTLIFPRFCLFTITL